jgi:hypothetical protein
MRRLLIFSLLSFVACSKREGVPEQRTAAMAQPVTSAVPSTKNDPSSAPGSSSAGDPSATPVPMASAATAGLRAQSAEECKRICNGKWGLHGIRQQMYCLCRTKDAGKDCEDGADCEGQCVLNDAELRTRVVDQGPPARGFFVGNCSEFVTVLGCVRRILRGTRQQGPANLDEPPLKLCAD